MEFKRQSLRRTAIAISLIFGILLFATAAWSQAISGDIVGVVTDSTKAVVPNAKVEALNVNTGAKATAKANASGEYRFTNLPIGMYAISATADGYGITTMRSAVELNKTSTVSLQLQVGKVSTTVEVAGVAPAVDTTTAQVQTSYDMQQMQELPSASLGLGVLNLSLLQAGVASAGSMGAGTGPSVGGQRPRNNNFTIEGVDNNDKGVTGPLVYVPNDAVAEFSVLQNQFSPEFGHSSGGQFNQNILSGTNTFHGKVYEYFQNRNLNAVDQTLKSQDILTNPRYDNNRFGGQVGGPVFKNKLFFFANYEYNPIGQSASSSPILAPTAAGYATLASLSGLNQQSIDGFKQYAIAPSACTADQIASKVCPKAKTVGGVDLPGGVLGVTPAGSSIPVPVEVGVLPVVAPNFQNGKALTTTMDYNISERDQLRGRYVYNKYVALDTNATLPVFYTDLTYPYHLATIAEYHQFSSRLSNEFRVGYNRTGYNYTVPDLKFPGTDAFPNLTIDDLNGINLGPDPNAPQYSTQNTYQITDNLSWVKGNHSLKFGVEGRKSISPQLFIQRSRGDYEWSTLSDFVNDKLPDFGERSFGAVGYSGDLKAIYWYVNDTWKVRSNLSLNIGVRYEYTGIPYGWTQMSLNSLASVPGVLDIGTPKAPKNGFMPRVGFSWSPGGNQNTAIRGGFGMSYDVLYDNIGTLSRPPQIGFTADCNNTTSIDGCVNASGAFMANGGIPPQASSGITTYSAADARAYTSSYLPINVKYPYSENWNLGVQHTFAKDYTLDVRYVGTRGVALNTQVQINKRSLVSDSANLPTYLSDPTQAQLDALTTTLSSLKAPGSVVPLFADAGFTSTITGYVPYGASTYHGLQTQLNRRFSNGLMFQAAWTWSHTIDNSTADFFSTYLTPRRPQDGLNMAADRSNSALDRRHRITLSVIYDMPFLKNSHSFFMKNVIGNWQFAPTYTYETGEWADVQSGTDSNLNGDNAGDRAILNPLGVAGTGSGVTALCTSGFGNAVTAGSLPSDAKCGQSGTWKAGTPNAGEDWTTNPYVVAYKADNPNAQYIVAGAGALSNAGRNTLKMRPINNVDFAIVKRVNITERMKYEFGAQLMNAFNHPQFIGGFVSTVNPVGSDAINGQVRSYLLPSASQFNTPSAIFSSNPRTMQLYMKLSF